MTLTRAFIFAIAGVLLVTACGQPEESGLFMRETPEGVAPIRPAPDLSDIRPVPDLHADRKALALICTASTGREESCACVARAGADAFRGRNLAWFAALVIHDPAEAARLEAMISQQRRNLLAVEAETILQQCGMI